MRRQTHQRTTDHHHHHQHPHHNSSTPNYNKITCSYNNLIDKMNRASSGPIVCNDDQSMYRMISSCTSSLTNIQDVIMPQSKLIQSSSADNFNINFVYPNTKDDEQLESASPVDGSHDSLRLKSLHPKLTSPTPVGHLRLSRHSNRRSTSRNIGSITVKVRNKFGVKRTKPTVTVFSDNINDDNNNNNNNGGGGEAGGGGLSEVNDKSPANSSSSLLSPYRTGPPITINNISTSMIMMQSNNNAPLPMKSTLVKRKSSLGSVAPCGVFTAAGYNTQGNNTHNNDVNNNNNNNNNSNSSGNAYLLNNNTVNNRLSALYTSKWLPPSSSTVSPSSRNGFSEFLNSVIVDYGEKGTTQNTTTTSTSNTGISCNNNNDNNNSIGIKHNTSTYNLRRHAHLERQQLYAQKPPELIRQKPQTHSYKPKTVKVLPPDRTQQIYSPQCTPVPLSSSSNCNNTMKCSETKTVRLPM
ncbi:unnamed protein product [Trichobilharzia regenti]|nr:unnamed protein product [Trichobilharzia regenti]